VDKSAPIEEEAATISNLGASIMIGFVIALLAGAALFSLFAAIAGVAMIAFFFAVCAVFSAFESSRKKTIERMGSVYVLAPGSRTWAGGSQPQA
jgi:uncharacterized membrane protein